MAGYINSKCQHEIAFKLIVSEVALASDQKVSTWLIMNGAIIASYMELDVYNADKTTLFYQMLPEKAHNMKGYPCAGDKHSKVCVTTLLCTNIDGSNWRSHFVIEKSKKPRGAMCPCPTDTLLRRG